MRREPVSSTLTDTSAGASAEAVQEPWTCAASDSAGPHDALETATTWGLTGPSGAGKTTRAQACGWRGTYCVIGTKSCVEAHVSTLLDVNQTRDPKVSDSRARAQQLSQMAGVQAANEAPSSPSLRLETSAMNILFTAVKQRFAVRSPAPQPHSP